MRQLLILSLCLCIAACNPLGKAVHVTVTSDDGSPVANASVTFRWSTNEPWGPSLRSGDPHSACIISDPRGGASARVTSDHYVGIDITHPLHYSGFATVVDSALSQHTTSATALPIPLKRILAPRPLAAKQAWVILPSLSGEAGYDFLAGDLVAPNGKGSIADAKLTWTAPPNNSKIEERRHYDILFETSGCGIIAQRVSNEGKVVKSALRSERLAPETGYLPSMRSAEETAGFGERGAWGEEGIIYYIRVSRDGGFRYGKILGEPSTIFYRDNPRPVIKFTYALNPSGDRSLEPDLNAISFPKSNGYEQPYKLPEGT